MTRLALFSLFFPLATAANAHTDLALHTHDAGLLPLAIGLGVIAVGLTAAFIQARTQ